MTQKKVLFYLLFSFFTCKKGGVKMKKNTYEKVPEKQNSESYRQIKKIIKITSCISEALLDAKLIVEITALLQPISSIVYIYRLLVQIALFLHALLIICLLLDCSCSTKDNFKDVAKIIEEYLSQIIDYYTFPIFLQLFFKPMVYLLNCILDAKDSK